VNTSGDNIPRLVLAAIASNNIDGGEILAEIAREGVDRETFAIRGSDRGAGEGASSCGIEFLGLSGRCSVKSNVATAKRDRDNGTSSQKREKRGSQHCGER
jgi:hypothetical protein